MKTFKNSKKSPNFTPKNYPDQAKTQPDQRIIHVIFFRIFKYYAQRLYLGFLMKKIDYSIQQLTLSYGLNAWIDGRLLPQEKKRLTARLRKLELPVNDILKSDLGRTTRTFTIYKYDDFILYQAIIESITFKHCAGDVSKINFKLSSGKVKFLTVDLTEIEYSDVEHIYSYFVKRLNKAVKIAQKERRNIANAFVVANNLNKAKQKYFEGFENLPKPTESNIDQIHLLIYPPKGKSRILDQEEGKITEELLDQEERNLAIDRERLEARKRRIDRFRSLA